MKPVVLNAARDVTLSPYIVTKKLRPCFLICPGGGYNNCEESESRPIAEAYNRKGYNAFVLRYSVGKHRGWPFPMEDFDAAMEHLRAHADEYHIDPDRIVAAGFSAGGHVVTCAASIARHKPFAAIACYGLTARETLDFCLPDAPDASALVTEETCPVFLASSRNDWIVPIFNTTRLIDAFQKNYVDYEAHIYGYALHGFRLGAKTKAKGPLFCSRVGDWFEESISWVEELSDGRYRSIKECAEYQDANSKTLSTMNSCAVIFANAGAAKLLKRKFPIQTALVAAAKKQVGAFVDTVSLRNVLELLKVNGSTIRKMDQVLEVFHVNTSK